MKELLNIVDDNDNIIGEADRAEIHAQGLLHREINIFFITPDRKIIFQHRSKNKDTNPDLLYATVAGHVEIGHSYEETAVKEAMEETGVKINVSDLMFICKTKKCFIDEISKKINNSFKCKYAYIYRGEISDLKVEDGEAVGFEVYSIDQLLNLSVLDKIKFNRSALEYATKELAEFINKLEL